MIKSLSALALSAGLFANAVEASPVYYTFTGTAHNSTYAPISVGDSVSYTFMVDLDLPGYYDFMGTINYYADDDCCHYFRTDYVTGDAIPIDYGVNLGAYQDYHVGLENYLSRFSGLTGSNQDQSGWDDVTIISLEDNVADWGIGQIFYGENSSPDCVNGVCQDIHVYSTLTLTSVSDIPPAAVPEPGTLALLGFGLIGVGVGARRACPAGQT